MNRVSSKFNGKPNSGVVCAPPSVSSTASQGKRSLKKKNNFKEPSKTFCRGAMVLCPAAEPKAAAEGEPIGSEEGALCGLLLHWQVLPDIPSPHRSVQSRPPIPYSELKAISLQGMVATNIYQLMPIGSALGSFQR